MTRDVDKKRKQTHVSFVTTMAKPPKERKSSSSGGGGGSSSKTAASAATIASVVAASSSSAAAGGGSTANDDIPPSAGYLISCDVPTKQFIQYLNELKPVDKKFIIQDLDSTHLLVKLKAREEITQKVEEWLDENVFSAVERVGEELDLS